MQPVATTFFFYFLSGLTLVAGILVITRRNPVHSALALILALLGQAGQPGYLVLALARQELMVPMLQSLLPSQREALARDWQAGHDLLVNHRAFLRCGRVGCAIRSCLYQREIALSRARSATSRTVQHPGDRSDALRQLHVHP